MKSISELNWCIKLFSFYYLFIISCKPICIALNERESCWYKILVLLLLKWSDVVQSFVFWASWVYGALSAYAEYLCAHLKNAPHRWGVVWVWLKAWTLSQYQVQLHINGYTQPLL